MSRQDASDVQWWAEQLQDKLSQGDVIADLPVFQATQPVKHLKKTTHKNNVAGWAESDVPVFDGEKKGYFLATGKLVPAIVISHSCELDKGKGRVIVAPIAPISSVSEDQQHKILGQKHFALMPLPEIPEIGTSYADLRSISALHRDIVDSARRVASMSDVATERLIAQIVAFFARKQM